MDKNNVRTNITNDEAQARLTRFGFTFGALNVERVSAVEGRGVCLKVETQSKALYIYASPTGRSLRVFEGNRDEMKVQR